MRTLSKRVRSAIEAFRDPSKTDEPTFGPRMRVTIDDDRMRDMLRSMLADAFEQFDAPDTEHKTHGYIDAERVGEISDDVVDRIHGVPEDALVQRIVIDAVNDVTVYYDERRSVERNADFDEEDVDDFAEDMGANE